MFFFSFVNFCKEWFTHWVNKLARYESVKVLYAIKLLNTGSHLLWNSFLRRVYYWTYLSPLADGLPHSLQKCQGLALVADHFSLVYEWEVSSSRSSHGSWLTLCSSYELMGEPFKKDTVITMSCETRQRRHSPLIQQMLSESSGTLYIIIWDPQILSTLLSCPHIFQFICFINYLPHYIQLDHRLPRPHISTTSKKNPSNVA